MPPRSTASPGKTKQAAPKTRAAKAATPAKKPAANKAPAKARTTRLGKSHVVSPDDRRRLISHAAYLRAERRGFAPGSELADWLEAEAEVDALLGSREAD